MRIRDSLAILVALAELPSCCLTPAQEATLDAGGLDAGGVADAGPTLDGGVPKDAGPSIDAGGPLDGGLLDGGPPPDAGMADCTIGGIGYSTGDLNPQNPCQTCQPAMLKNGWTNLSPGAPCGNGLVCDPNQSCGPPPAGCQVGTVQVPDRASNPNDLSRCCNHRSNPYAWTPRFAQGGTFSVPSGATDLAVADFDGDGFSDIAVVANNQAGPEMVYVFLNPKGRLQAPIPYLASSETSLSDHGYSEILTPDLNGDLSFDLVTEDWSIGRISVLMNHGDGRFSTPTEYGLPNGFNRIGFGDFNGDQRPDIVYATYYLSVMSGIGDGGFLPPVNIPQIFGGALHSVVAVGDFNRDGLPDLAATNFYWAPVTIFYGSLDSQGNRTLTEGPNYGTYPGITDLVGPMVPMDIDGDGIQDLVLGFYSAAGGLVVLLGQGDGTFGTWTVYPMGGIAEFATADLEGNGAQRLLISRYSDAESQPVAQLQEVRLGPDGGLTADLLLSPDGGYFDHFRIGDFNGDGAEDVASLDGTIYLNGCP